MSVIIPSGIIALGIIALGIIGPRFRPGLAVDLLPGRRRVGVG